MDIGTILGFVFGFFSIVVLGMRGEFMPYFDVPSIGIVFGGCVTSVLMGVSMKTIKGCSKTLMLAFKYKADDPVALVKKIIEFSEIARRDGILALENVLPQIQDPFLKQGIQLAVDGTDPELIQDIMDTEMETVDARHGENRRLWETFRNGGPSWGAMGTSIGLIAMLKGGVDDPAMLASGMAIALITTFYGSLVSSFFVGPLCDKLVTRNNEELELKAIMLKGVMSIQAGDNPRIVEQKLKILLPPSQRGFGKDG